MAGKVTQNSGDKPEGEGQEDEGSAEKMNRNVCEIKVVSAAKAVGMKTVTGYQVSLFDNYVLVIGVDEGGENMAVTVAIDEVSLTTLHSTLRRRRVVR